MMLGAAALCATSMCARARGRARDRDGGRSRPSATIDRSVARRRAADPRVELRCIRAPILGLVVVAMLRGAAGATRHAARALVRRRDSSLARARARAVGARALRRRRRARRRVAGGRAHRASGRARTLGDRERLGFPRWRRSSPSPSSSPRAVARARCRSSAAPRSARSLASRFARNLYEAILLAAPVVGLAVARRAVASRRGSSSRARHRPRRAGVHAAPRARRVQPALRRRPRRRRRPARNARRATPLPAAHVMNDCTLGGWLIWQRIPVYCDGRAVALYRKPTSSASSYRSTPTPPPSTPSPIATTSTTRWRASTATSTTR